MTDKTSNQSQPTSKIDYFVHAIVADGRGERIGNSIGVAFNNKSGNGFTMYLDASPIPIDGQVKMVALKPTPKA